MKPFEQLLFVLFGTFLIYTTDAYVSLKDYVEKYEMVDRSALALCWTVSGTVDEVEPGNEVKGYKCTAQMQVWTSQDDNNKKALEYCESRFPFHIMSAKSYDDGGTAITECTYQINLVCDEGWYQISNKCYKIVPSAYTFKEAQALCSRGKTTEFQPRVAEYYTESLGLYFGDLIFVDAWVTVPDIKEYFRNGESDVAVFVQDGAFKYDVKPGSLILPEGDEKHHVICEYLPAMTKAEMYYMAEKYKEIYPIRITSTGASISTSSYLTLDSDKNVKEKFRIDSIQKSCTAIGAILNTKGFPLISLKEEWEDVKDGLGHHRFYLTAAFKNDGCSRKAYMDTDSDGKEVEVYKDIKAGEKGYCEAHSFVFSNILNSGGDGRYPAMAAMRAPALCTLHTYGFEYAPCESGWHGFTRANGAIFCHFIQENEVLGPSEARTACHNRQAALSGFDSSQEFEFVRWLLHPDNQKFPIAETHYRLGGQHKCQTNCFDGQGRKYFGGWDEGVSRDTHFLNTFGGNFPTYDTDAPLGFGVGRHLSFRRDAQVFHLHPDDWYPLQYYVCGKYSQLVTKKDENWKLRKSHAK